MWLLSRMSALKCILIKCCVGYWHNSACTQMYTCPMLTYVRMCVYVCTYVHMCNVNLCMYASPMYTYVCMHLQCIPMYVCISNVYLCMYASPMYTYVYTWPICMYIVQYTKHFTIIITVSFAQLRMYISTCVHVKYCEIVYYYYKQCFSKDFV